MNFECSKLGEHRSSPRSSSRVPVTQHFEIASKLGAQAPSPSMEFESFLFYVPLKLQPTFRVEGVHVTFLLIAVEKSIIPCSWQGSGLLKAVDRRIHSSAFVENF